MTFVEINDVCLVCARNHKQ